MTDRSPRRHPGVRVLEATLALAGLACLGWWAWQVAAADRFQREAALELERARQQARVAPEAPATPAPVAGIPRGSAAPHAPRPRRGEVIGRIDVPAARISAMVAAGADDATLARAVGLLPGTPPPGAHGRTVLAGHRDTWFRGLGRVRRGDAIRMATPNGTYTYRITATRVVDPHDVGVLDTGPDPGLTLVTCWPFHYVGPAPERFIVQAALVGSDDIGAPIATLAAAATPAAPRPMRVAAAHAVRPAHVAAVAHRRPRHEATAPVRLARRAPEDDGHPAKEKRVWDDHWALH